MLIIENIERIYVQNQLTIIFGTALISIKILKARNPTQKTPISNL